LNNKVVIFCTPLYPHSSLKRSLSKIANMTPSPYHPKWQAVSKKLRPDQPVLSELPREIWDMIYSNVFGDTNQCISLASLLSRKNDRDSTLTCMPCAIIQSRCGSPRPQLPSIITPHRTCEQSHAEALPLLHRRNVFSFDYLDESEWTTSCDRSRNLEVRLVPYPDFIARVELRSIRMSNVDSVADAYREYNIHFRL
jgi:hypothetical protein